jgi:hypothetical protein
VDREVDGGRGGTEAPFAFLEEGLRVLKEDGSIIALLSEEGDINSFIARCEGRDLSVQEIGKRRLFFEVLVVLKIERARSSD